MSQYDLTICLVSFNSQDYLKLNWQLTNQLNQNPNWQWVVVDNTPPAANVTLDLADPRCTIVPGVEPDMTKLASYRGSYHHAAGLNKALSYVNTRFALILDPDFYIVRENWVEDVLAHMVQHNLSFFGVPWHPRWQGKYRYFPCVHCLFIDLEKIPVASLDFMPEIHLVWKDKKAKTKTKSLEAASEETAEPVVPVDSLESGEPEPAWRLALKQRLPEETVIAIQETLGVINAIIRAIRKLPRRLYRAVMRLYRFAKDVARVLALKNRKSIGGSLDTGYKVFREYQQKPGIRSECAVPVYRLQSDYLGSPYALTPLNRLAEKFLPDRRCHIPKQPGYFTEIGFRDTGYPDVSSQGWEEFFWQGKPFGFHVRCQRQDKTELVEAKQSLGEVLECFVNAPRSEVTAVK